VAVMEQTKSIEADKEMQGVKPQLPAAGAIVDWPQAGYNPSHTLPNAEIHAHMEKIWSADIGKGSDSDYKLLARPVIGGGQVFTMDSHGMVSAFNAETGEKNWAFETTPSGRDEDAIGGGVGLNDDTLYATTGFGEVLALSAKDGSVRWRHLLFNPLRAAPTIADGHVYVVSIDNELSALDAGTGELLWHQNGIAESATLMGASNPAVVGDSVVVAYSSGEIFNLRMQNGRVSWNYTLATPTQVGALPAIADIRGLPVMDRGRILAISHSGRIASIDQRSGDRNWEADIGGINTPLVSGDAVFILSNNDQLVALARDTGRILWVQELQHRLDPSDQESDPVYWAGPILAGGQLWLTNSLGELDSFSSDDGAPLASVSLDESSYIPPSVANSTMYVVTDDGYLVAYR
jgi:outer membrane protein assembly factor BamB